MGFRATLIVEMADGETYDVVIDQRDLAAGEANDAASNENALHTRTRFLGWHAAKREGRYAGQFPAFNEKDCIDVSAKVDPEDAESDGGYA